MRLVSHVHCDLTKVDVRCQEFLDADPAARRLALAELQRRATVYEAGASVPALFLSVTLLGTIGSLWVASQSLVSSESSAYWTSYVDLIDVITDDQQRVRDVAAQALVAIQRDQAAYDTQYLTAIIACALVLTVAIILGVTAWRDGARGIATFWLSAYNHSLDELEKLTRDEVTASTTEPVADPGNQQKRFALHRLRTRASRP